MNSAPKTSKAELADEPAIDMAELGRALMKRRAAYEARTGTSCELPRNSGNRRTASKQALLKAVEEAGGKW